MKRFVWLGSVVWAIIASAGWAEEPPAPEFSKDVAPLFRKYCAGCHNAADREAKLSVESFSDLMKGGEHGPAVLPGDPDSSRIVRLLTGAADPRMPPEGEPAPTPAEIEQIKAWIAAGARGPDGAERDRLALMVPEIESQTDTRPIVAIDISPDGRWLAAAQYTRVTIRPVSAAAQAKPAPLSGEDARVIDDFPGPVTAVHFDTTGDRLVTAAGVNGLGGVAAIWNIADGKLVREFRGHRDTLYDAELSPDGKVLATCSYDREIILWNAETGEQLRTLSGHNGAVYDVAFSPDGRFLASASADDTCKVWRIDDGERMDTLGQPLEEQYCVAFSPDGRLIVAGGADNRIRVWRFISKNKPRINPLLIARFAHEGAVLQLQFTPDGRGLVSVAEDRTSKVWETKDFNEIHLQSESALAQSLAVSERQFVIGLMNGTAAAYALPEPSAAAATIAAAAPAPVLVADDDPMSLLEEAEPNNNPTTAGRINPPARITGVILGRQEETADHDLFRMTCRAGERWVIEVNAARRKSPLDSYVEVLDAAGEPVERVLLQAVRDSYFTFRGKNADEIGDFRVFNWEEMELNEYLYANGEVVKLYMYPRGPDSGFNVYPAVGKRWGYFDTTPLAHALGEPCYIVEPHEPGSEIIPNGLPVFPVYFENDDESTRSAGTDSKLYFTAPRDGDYLVRIRDVRNLEGDNFTYQLEVRPPEPDFRVTVHDANPSVPPGGCREFRVSATRIDGFDGPITVDITGLPPGFRTAAPVVIEAGQVQAYGVICCDEDAPKPTEQNQLVSVSQAVAVINGKEVTHPGMGLGKITRADKKIVEGRIVPAEGGASPVAAAAEGPLEFEIAPGETIMLKVRVERPDNKGEVSFGKEDSGRNLPHGVYVDNIGLNGLLLLDGQPEREFFITAADWVPEQSRLFHLESNAHGGFATPPVLLHVRKQETAP